MLRVLYGLFQMHRRLFRHVGVEPAFQPVDIVITRQNVRLLQQRMEQRHSRVDPIDDQFPQGPVQSRQRFRPIATMHNQFRD